QGEGVIFVSVGLPGRFGQWCDAVIAQLAGHSGASVTVKSWPPLTDMLGYHAITPTLDEAALTLLSTDDVQPLGVGLRQPDAGLFSALTDTDARFVVSLDHPRNAAAGILAEVRNEVRAVTRAVANSCASILRYPSLRGALLVHADRARADIAGT